MVLGLRKQLCAGAVFQNETQKVLILILFPVQIQIQPAFWEMNY